MNQYPHCACHSLSLSYARLLLPFAPLSFSLFLLLAHSPRTLSRSWSFAPFLLFSNLSPSSPLPFQFSPHVLSFPLPAFSSSSHTFSYSCLLLSIWSFCSFFSPSLSIFFSLLLYSSLPAIIFSLFSSLLFYFTWQFFFVPFSFFLSSANPFFLIYFMLRLQLF